MVKLFVSGFPLDISELDLVKLFIPHGDVATVKIVRNKKTGTCKGYAFLEMKELNSAERAIEALDYSPSAGRMLTVRIVEEPGAEHPQPQMNGSAGAHLQYVRAEQPLAIVKKKRPRRHV